MELMFKLILFLFYFMDVVTRPIYWYFALGKKQKVSTPTNQLLTLSATKLAAKIRRKEVSSELVVQTYINRIKDVNPIINAIADERFDEAIQEARNIDKYLSKCSLSEEELEKSKPLLGVPLTVKESCSLKGMSLTGGQLSRENYKADVDGKIVARVRANGAIPLLVSNTPELCLSMESYNLLKGRTNNPYDSTRTAGGSSGGEGALLGAAASIIGIGSDIAGSIRAPALFNGIFGHKPSPRIANIEGHYPCPPDDRIHDFLSIGPLVRYAEDLNLMMNVIVEPQLKTKLRLNEKVNLNKLNIFFMEDAGFFSLLTPVEKEIKKLILRAINYLKDNCGSTVQKHKFVEYKDALEVCQQGIFAMEGRPNPFKTDEDVYTLEIEFVKSIFGYSKYSPNLINIFMQEKLCKFFILNDYSLEVTVWRQNFINKLKDNGVFIYPTAPVPAQLHNKFYFLSQMAGYTLLANTLGLPSTHVPCGLNNKGLPIGFQVMAAPNQDRLCLAVAEEMEKCFGGWVPP